MPANSTIFLILAFSLSLTVLSLTTKQTYCTLPTNSQLSFQVNKAQQIQLSDSSTVLLDAKTSIQKFTVTGADYWQTFFYTYYLNIKSASQIRLQIYKHNQNAEIIYNQDVQITATTYESSIFIYAEGGIVALTQSQGLNFYIIDTAGTAIGGSLKKVNSIAYISTFMNSQTFDKIIIGNGQIAPFYFQTKKYAATLSVKLYTCDGATSASPTLFAYSSQSTYNYDHSWYSSETAFLQVDTTGSSLRVYGFPASSPSTTSAPAATLTGLPTLYYGTVKVINFQNKFLIGMFNSAMTASSICTITGSATTFTVANSQNIAVSGTNVLSYYTDQKTSFLQIRQLHPPLPICSFILWTPMPVHKTSFIIDTPLMPLYWLILKQIWLKLLQKSLSILIVKNLPQVPILPNNPCISFQLPAAQAIFQNMNYR